MKQLFEPDNRRPFLEIALILVVSGVGALMFAVVLGSAH